MKNLTLTLTISSLILSILFFAYLARNASTVGSTDHDRLLQNTDTVQRVTTRQPTPDTSAGDDTEAEPIRFLNDGN